MEATNRFSAATIGPFTGTRMKYTGYPATPVRKGQPPSGSCQRMRFPPSDFAASEEHNIDWLDWYNNHHLHNALGYLPRAE